jgi:hypothetical protein
MTAGQQLGEAVQITGLAEKSIESTVIASDARIIAITCRRGDKEDPPKVRLAAEEKGCFAAVDPGHLNVQERAMRLEIVGRDEGRESIISDPDFVFPQS